MRQLDSGQVAIFFGTAASSCRLKNFQISALTLMSEFTGIPLQQARHLGPSSKRLMWKRVRIELICRALTWF